MSVFLSSRVDVLAIIFGAMLAIWVFVERPGLGRSLAFWGWYFHYSGCFCYQPLARRVGAFFRWSVA